MTHPSSDMPSRAIFAPSAIQPRYSAESRPRIAKLPAALRPGAYVPHQTILLPPHCRGTISICVRHGIVDGPRRVGICMCWAPHPTVVYARAQTTTFRIRSRTLYLTTASSFGCLAHGLGPGSGEMPDILAKVDASDAVPWVQVSASASIACKQPIDGHLYTH